MNKTIEVKDIGFVDYKKAWDLQESILEEVAQIKNTNRETGQNKETPNHFLFVEHPHVYTLGKSGHMSNLLIGEGELEKKGITFYKINRGGDITYHGPGQIVGYPIIDLENFFTDIHKYIRGIEQVIIRVLDHYNIKGETSQGETGVWVDVGTPFARKICAIGVRCSRWITMHGFALNANTDLGYFDHIIPCGIKGKAVSSMEAELGEKVDVDKVKDLIVKHFSEVFGAEMKWKVEK